MAAVNAASAGRKGLRANGLRPGAKGPGNNATSSRSAADSRPQLSHAQVFKTRGSGAVLDGDTILDSMDCRTACATTASHESIHREGGRARGVGDEGTLRNHSAEPRSNASRMRHSATPSSALRAARVRGSGRSRPCVVLAGQRNITCGSVSSNQERQRPCRVDGR